MKPRLNWFVLSSITDGNINNVDLDDMAKAGALNAVATDIGNGTNVNDNINAFFSATTTPEVLSIKIYSSSFI